ncbi:MAG: peptidylprolyl isomerase [Actinomycetota bacterium]
MSKTVKRQRKKDYRREKLEAEHRAAKGRRRTRLIMSLGLLSALAGAAAVLLIASRPSAACPKITRRSGDTAPVSRPPAMCIDTDKTYTARIRTSLGPIEVRLADDLQPKTVNSFVFLARKGFYDGLGFHRVVKDFAIQGGDPKGDGSGGPGYKVTESPRRDTRYPKGAVAMAKAGADPPGTSGSQFFLVPGDGAAGLPPEFAVLGRVISGDEVMAKIQAIPTGGPGEGSKPTEPITIVRIDIRES